MNREDFEKAKKIETEIEDIKEAISMLKMFIAYPKEKKQIRDVMMQNLKDKLKELNEEFENI